MEIADEQEGDGEAGAMEDGRWDPGGAVADEGGDECVNGGFAGPAEAKAGDGDAELSGREHAFGIFKELDGHFGAGGSLLGELAEARGADGEEGDFDGGEEGIGGEDENDEEKPVS